MAERKAQHFEVTNVGANHDLMQLFGEPFPGSRNI